LPQRRLRQRDDASTPAMAAAGRFFSQALFDQNLRDSISSWQWFEGPSAGAAALPAISAHPNFSAGFDLADDWQPNALPFTRRPSTPCTLMAPAGWLSPGAARPKCSPRRSMAMTRPWRP